MALPPTIPTSFVPRPNTSAPLSRASLDLSRAFLLLSAFLLGLVILAALGIFLYGQYLASAQTSKDTAVASAQAQIDQNTIASFIQLQEQLLQGKTLLDQHIAYSGFFDALSSLSPSTVSYSSLTLSTNDDHSGTVAFSGTAATFNALAVLSASLATDSNIKSAIFSGIAVNQNGSVGFSVSATLAPALVEIPATGVALPVAPAAPAATTSSATVSTSTTTKP
ncbi:MAG: hypothetical protein ACREGR_02030 [Minisyncoccia bacterium]